MNPFDHMSPPFVNANRDALEKALFDQIVNPSDNLGNRIQMGLRSIGNGIAWFGFWIAVGLIGFGALK